MSYDDDHQIRPRGVYWLPNLLTTAALFSGFYAIVAAIAGALMISRFAFNSFKQVTAGARVRFPHIVLVPLAFVLIFTYPSITLLVLCGGYALSAPLVWAYRKLRKRNRAHSAHA
jgi:phosphatidylserine synthase